MYAPLISCGRTFKVYACWAACSLSCYAIVRYVQLQIVCIHAMLRTIANCRLADITTAATEYMNEVPLSSNALFAIVVHEKYLYKAKGQRTKV